MSKSTNRALLQLAVVAGCVNTMRQNNSFARVDIRRLIDKMLLDITDAVIHWPCTGDEEKNARWIKERREKWNAFIEDDPDESYSAVVLAKMCERVLTALDEVTRDEVKRRLLAPIYEASQKINNFCDPNGANFPAYEKADFLLGELYALIDWREYA